MIFSLNLWLLKNSTLFFMFNFAQATPNQTLSNVQTLSNEILKLSLIFVTFSGCFGNLAAVFIIVATDLKKVPVNQYLLSIALSDTVFLLLNYLTFFTTVKNHSRFLCLAVRYCRNVSCFISSWTITALSIERYHVIFNPFSSLKHCSM